MLLIRRATARLGFAREAIVQPLELRQDTDNSTNSASPASTASAASITSLATSITSSANSTSSSSAPSSGGPTSIEFETVPAFTATKTTAYTAHGVNATDIKTSHTSTLTADGYLATANATSPGIPHNDLTACRINGTEPENGPFCSPIHRQDLWTGYTYGVTWNSDLFASNSSATVLLTYDTQEQGTVAWYSPSVPNIKGYVNIFMESAWLLGASGNDTSTGQNLTFSFLSTPLGGGQNITKPGPMISLTVDPSTLPRVELPNLPGKYGLEIGLPIGLVAFVLIVLGIWCGMRKNNQSWAKVRGHSKDYMSKRARRRGRSGKDAAIQLEEYDRRQEAFSDEPFHGGSGNAFRDEVARQRDEDDRSLKRTVTSF